jgi:Icc-related predicted phosphoesterase
VTLFVGDVHGLFTQYKRIIKEHKNTIQVGDLRVGYRSLLDSNYGQVTGNPPHKLMADNNARWYRGNHDNPHYAKGHSQWIKDGYIEGDMMFVGGAQSIDAHLRQEGFNWWREEELSTPELYDVLDKYVAAKPKIMCTHDCPEEVLTELAPVFGKKKLETHSRTRQALQAMWEAHQPDVWVFGHHHRSFDGKLNGTRFVCLDELEVKDI